MLAHKCYVCQGGCFNFVRNLSVINAIETKLTNGLSAVYYRNWIQYRKETIFKIAACISWLVTIFARSIAFPIIKAKFPSSSH